MSEPGWSFVLGAGLGFALLNALHCLGMCGAFALAAAGTAGARAPRLSLYLLGKTFTYVFLGALAGAAGGSLSRAFGPARLVLGLLVGAALIVAGARLLAGSAAAGTWGPVGRAFVATLAGPLARLRAAREGGAWGASFALGGLTGLLPCGVSWLAALQAAALGGPARGAAFLAAFGLGTAPALLLAGLAGGGLLARLGARRARLAGGGLLLAAGLLALLRAGMASGVEDPGSCPACPDSP
jgi:hypothetical protein